VVIVGSMNLDARSRWANTELALSVRSPELARQIFEAFRVDEGYGVRIHGVRPSPWRHEPQRVKSGVEVA